jgi:hypothetical protein
MTLALDSWKSVDGLLYEKELLPVGPVTKWINGEKQVTDVNVQLSFLERMVDQFKKFKEVGVRVPLFKSHIEDVDNDRGTIEDVFIRENSKGTPSLFGKVAFSSEDAAAVGSKVDVSVMCPPKFVDGKGNRYEFPLRHVALTSIPVVPGLEPFRPIVLSFDTPSGLLELECAECEEENVELADAGTEEEVDPLSETDALILIADLLQVDLSAGNQAIVDAVTVLLGGEEGVTDDEVPLEAGNPVTPAAPLNKRAIDQLHAGRKAQLDALVLSHVLSPALAAKYLERYANDEAISLDFSASDTAPTMFDTVLELAQEIAKDRPITKSPRNVVTASNNSDDSNLPATVRDAKKRAAAAAPHKA